MVGTERGWLKDPLGGKDGQGWREEGVRKVFVM
jgi:macrophage erythroblast attacher